MTTGMPETAPLTSLAVLVVNFGAADVLEENLRRSLGDDFPGQVVIADNYFSEAERERVTRTCERNGWHLLAIETNVGYGGGNNRAAAYAIEQGATELLLLNPDAWLSPDAIVGLHDRVVEDRLLQVSPTILRPDGRTYSAEFDLHLGIGEMKAASRRPPGTDPSSVHTWVSGACFMISAALWQRVGGFDEAYFLYWEDVDLSRRIVLAGGRVAADPTITAVHDEGVTHRSGGNPRHKSPTYYYYNVRNRLLYATKHLPPSASRRWVLSSPVSAYRVLLQGGRRQFIRPTQNIWPALRGAVAGVREWRRYRRGASSF